MNAINPEFIKRSHPKAKGLGADPLVNLRMPPELIAALKDEATRRGVKPPVIIREGLVRLLAQSEASRHFENAEAA